MKAGLQRFAWRMWRGEAGWPGRLTRALLISVEAGWRFVTGWRNRRWDRRGGVEVDGLAVVSVGNVAVGGTGKTPFSAWIARTLAQSGATPVLLLRGYGDDEIALHRRWNAAIPVVVGSDRVKSARRGRSGGADIAVLDDGFQHRRLARHLDVVLLAAEDPIPAPLLPRGPYREPLTALRRADVVVVTRRRVPAGVARRTIERLVDDGYLAPDAVNAGVRLETGELVPLREHLARVSGAERGPPPLSDAESLEAESLDYGTGALERSAVPELTDPLVVTAIARPDAFLRDVESVTHGTAELLAFADHHAFTAMDARRARVRAGTRPVVITEKDAVKLGEYVDILGETWVARQRIAWDWGEEAVSERLARLCAATTERGR